MPKLKRAKDVRDLRHYFDDIRSTTAGDTRFLAQAVMLNSERLARIEVLLEQQLKVAQQAQVKAKRPPSEWQRFFAAGMKAGKTPAEIGAECGWLDRLREAGEAAVSGPWSHGKTPSDIYSPEFDPTEGTNHSFVCGDVRRADADFIILARNTWPLLVAVAEAAERTAATYYDAGGDMTGPLGEALDHLDIALASLREAATE